MPSLFPSDTIYKSNLSNKVIDENYEFKSTYAYDFVNKKFLKNNDGTIRKLSVYDSYILWCHKALMTTRYMYCIYSYTYGVDKIDFVNLDTKAIELEIIRTVTECLKVHPLTKTVNNFTFIWGNSKVDYTFELVSTMSSSILSSTIELR